MGVMLSLDRPGPTPSGGRRHGQHARHPIGHSPQGRLVARLRRGMLAVRHGVLARLAARPVRQPLRRGTPRPIGAPLRPERQVVGAGDRAG